MSLTESEADRTMVVQSCQAQTHVFLIHMTTCATSLCNISLQKEGINPCESKDLGSPSWVSKKLGFGLAEQALNCMVVSVKLLGIAGKAGLNPACLHNLKARGAVCFWGLVSWWLVLDCKICTFQLHLGRVDGLVFLRPQLINCGISWNSLDRPAC